MADGSTKRCGDCNDGTMVCEECDDDGVVDCECDYCGDRHDRTCPECEGIFGRQCETCEGKGRVLKTDGDLEAEGQINFLQKETTT